MLTKDLLHYRNRSGRIYPAYLQVADPELLALAGDLIGIFTDACGLSLGEVDDLVSESAWAAHPVTPALKKLLFDRCDEAEDDGQVAAMRTNTLRLAEQLRAASDYPTLEGYQAAVAAACGMELAAMQERLYADLPEFRVIKTFEPLTPAALLHRYNCAQIQGLLLVAQQVKVTFQDASLAEKRRFFRCLKFQRLLSEVAVAGDAKETTCVLSGPLRIFQNSQSYGMRLAQFFPYILQLPRWKLSAEVKVNGKTFSLECDHSVGIVSHYKAFTPFIPPELTAFIAAFNERDGAFTASLGEDYLAIGRQSYCFPDVTFVEAGGRVVHLEIFHRWHAGQLAGRLKALAVAPEQPLVIGVAQDIAGDRELAAALAASAWFSVNGFTFKNLPTPKAVQQVLARHAAAGRPARSLVPAADAVLLP